MLGRLIALTLCLCLVLSVDGCSKPAPDFAPVHGTLHVKGKLLRGMRVNFLPDAEKGNQWNAIARGTTDGSGKYSLEYEFEGKEGTGAPVGWHRVIVEDTTRPPTPQGQTPPPPLIPVKYSNPASTPLLKEVKPGEQTIDLEVTE